MKPIHVRTLALLIPFFRLYSFHLPEDKLVRIINALTSHPARPLESGKIESWAAAIAYTILNYDDQYRAYHSLQKNAFICSYFNISSSTFTRKSRLIRDIMQQPFTSLS